MCLINVHEVYERENNLLNNKLSKVVSEQGHKDVLIVIDAGFAIPKGLEVIKLSLSVNKPKVVEVLEELKKYYSVEQMYMAQETKDVIPIHFEAVSKVWGEAVPVEVVSHAKLREMSKIR